MYMCMIFLTSTLHNNSQNAIIQLHVSYIVIAIRAISGPVLGALVMQDQLILSGQPGSNGQHLGGECTITTVTGPVLLLLLEKAHT